MALQRDGRLARAVGQCSRQHAGTLFAFTAMQSEVCHVKLRSRPQRPGHACRRGRDKPGETGNMGPKHCGRCLPVQDFVPDKGESGSSPDGSNAGGKPRRSGRSEQSEVCPKVMRGDQAWLRRVERTGNMARMAIGVVS